MTRIGPFGPVRRPVRREGAEGYLFVTLVSFPVTVIGTRWFLSVTGFPQIGVVAYRDELRSEAMIARPVNGSR